jgi:hypothetical protein
MIEGGRGGLIPFELTPAACRFLFLSGRLVFFPRRRLDLAQVSSIEALVPTPTHCNV